MQAKPPQKPQIKQRPQGIPLDYYKGRDRMGRLRLALVILAPVLALGWWFGGALLTGDQSRMRYSRGEVAHVHAMWETNCEACHEPFKRMPGQLQEIVALVPNFQANTDAKCASCHKGTVHHTYQLDALTPSCAECHRDHQGRNFSLLHTDDAQCTICHSSLPAGIDSTKLTKVGGQVGYEDITRFDRDHSEFGVRVINANGRKQLLGRLVPGQEPNDPSELKFNHQLHLEPGLGLNYSYAKMRPEDRRHYGWTDSTPLSDEVKLDCASCHVLDSGDLKVPSDPGGVALANYPPRSSGSYMLPIVFENHCRACHQLTVGVPEPGQKPLEVPHGRQPDEVRAFLEQAVAEQVLGGLREARAADLTPEQRDALQQSKKDAEALLRKMLEDAAEPPDRSRQADAQTLGEQADGQLARAERSLYQGTQTCAECHHFVRPESNPARLRIKPTQVPTVWFQHGAFDHSAHRAVRCAECHTGVEQSTDSNDILLFGQDSGERISTLQVCQQCHAPAERSSGGLVRGGADFSCVECHRYHNGEHPLQGIGAVARTATHERSVSEFLRGVVNPGTSAETPSAD
ncbi:hypothetical protein BH23PLA1_BH23PLA1_24610 [soil metagenome]